MHVVGNVGIFCIEYLSNKVWSGQVRRFWYSQSSEQVRCVCVHQQCSELELTMYTGHCTALLSWPGHVSALPTTSLLRSARTGHITTRGELVSLNPLLALIVSILVMCGHLAVCCTN